MKRIVLAAVVLSLGAAGCRRPPATHDEKPAAAPHKDKEAEAHDDDHGHEALPKKVTLSAEVAKEAGVETTAVARLSLQATVALPGEVAADPDRAARVASPVAGRIERVFVSEGATVKKGDTVATLRVPDLGRIRGALIAAKAKGRSARAHEERLKALYEKGLTPEQTYFDTRADAEALEAEARALSEHLASLGASGQGGASTLALRAPLGGVVVPRDAVVDLAGRSVVFVKGGGDEYEVHDVVLGEGAAGKVEVVSGLREGEVVVSRGAFTLKSLVLKGTMAHDD